MSTDGKVHPANVCVWCNRPFPDTYPPALRAASSLSQEEWEILLHALDCIDEGHEALRAKVRELASAPGPGPVEKADIPVTR